MRASIDTESCPRNRHSESGGLSKSSPTVDKTSLVVKTAGMAIALQAENWTSTYLREQQQADADIAPALIWLEGEEGRPDWSSVAAASPALRALYQQYQSLVLREGVLYRIFHNLDAS